MKKNMHTRLMDFDPDEIVTHPSGRKAFSLRQRFWRKVNKFGPTVRVDLEPCWDWTGGLIGSGYGCIWIGRKGDGSMVTASRVSFFLAHGRWPVPNCLHRCDRRCCVNPSHLYEGTDADNTSDKVSRGRLKTHMVPGHKLSARKLTHEDIGNILGDMAESLLAGRSEHNKIAIKYGVNPSNLTSIMQGKTLCHDVASWFCV